MYLEMFFKINWFSVLIFFINSKSLFFMFFFPMDTELRFEKPDFRESPERFDLIEMPERMLRFDFELFIRPLPLL